MREIQKQFRKSLKLNCKEISNYNILYVYLMDICRMTIEEQKISMENFNLNSLSMKQEINSRLKFKQKKKKKRKKVSWR